MKTWQQRDARHRDRGCELRLVGDRRTRGGFGLRAQFPGESSRGLDIDVMRRLGGGSGSSSTCQPQKGTVTGVVLVVGSPKGFSPAVLGAEACTGSGSTPCSNPVSTVAGGNGAYSLSLAAGSGPCSVSTRSHRRAVVPGGVSARTECPAGGTIHENLDVFYLKPATLAGTITVTGASSNDPIKKLTVVVCPSSVAFSGGTVPNGCASGSVKPSPKGSASGSYSVTNLPPVAGPPTPVSAHAPVASPTRRQQTVKLKRGRRPR